tara:strand:- start:333 stop:626 length:294 start_codon:yes stop_codon:yes gene_type:complete
MCISIPKTSKDVIKYFSGILCGLALISHANANKNTAPSIITPPASLKNDQIISLIVWENNTKTKFEKEITEMYVKINGFKLIKDSSLFTILLNNEFI